MFSEVYWDGLSVYKILLSVKVLVEASSHIQWQLQFYMIFTKVGNYKKSSEENW